MSAPPERSHELRNGLAGLAGITHLLSAEGGEDHERLTDAVLAELGRLASSTATRPNHLSTTTWWDPSSTGS